MGNINIQTSTERQRCIFNVLYGIHLLLFSTFCPAFTPLSLSLEVIMIVTSQQQSVNGVLYLLQKYFFH